MLCFVKVHYRPQKQKVKDFSLFLCKYIVHDIYAFFPTKKQPLSRTAPSIPKYSRIPWNTKDFSHHIFMRILLFFKQCRRFYMAQTDFFLPAPKQKKANHISGSLWTLILFALEHFSHKIAYDFVVRTAFYLRGNNGHYFPHFFYGCCTAFGNGFRYNLLNFVFTQLLWKVTQ